MTIAFRSIGTVGTGTTSVTAGLPGSLATGDLVLLFVMTKPDTATFTTPTGWSLVADVAGGGGTTGSAVGPTRQAVFSRVKDASWSAMPAVTVTNGNATAAAAVAYSKTLATWATAAATGTYGSGATTTNGAATLGSNPGITAGDWCVVGYSSMVDTPTWSAQGITATGISAFGTATERSEVIETTTGNDVGGMVFDRPVTTGTATAAPATQATLSVASRGTVALVRIREVAAPGQGTASGSFSYAGAAVGFKPVPTVDITHVNSSTAQVSSNVATLDVPVPTGTQNGDLLLWSVTRQNVNDYPSDPAGWTRIATGSTIGLYIVTWYKFASSSEPATYTTPDMTAFVARTASVMTALRGVDPTTPLDVPAPAASVGTTALGFPAITPATGNAWAIALAAHSYASGGTGAIVPGVLPLLGEAAGDGASGTNINDSVLGGEVTAGTAFTPTATTSGTATRTLGLTLAIRPKPLTATPGQGTAAGSWSFAGAASGARSPKGTGSGSWSFAGAATGKRTPKATAAGSWSFVGAAVGATTKRGTTSGSWGFVGAASGRRVPKASAAGSWSFTGSAVGAAPAVAGRTGTASGTWTFTGSATGARASRGASVGAWSYAGTAVGQTVKRGAATGTWTFAGAAAGRRAAKGGASGSYSYSGTATGTRAARGAAAGSFAYTGAATGAAPLVGVNDGSASGSWTYAGTAIGTTAKRGTASGSYAYTGAAVGSRPVVGGKTGSASGTYGYQGTAVGKRVPKGSASGTFLYVGTAVSTRAATGTAAGSWTYVGAAVGSATGGQPEPPPTVITPEPTLVVRREQRTLVVGVEKRTLRVGPRPELDVTTEEPTLVVGPTPVYAVT